MMMIAPVLLLAFGAQWLVKSRFAWASKIAARVTGAQAARRILDAHGMNDVRIEAVQGKLSDHYDPKSKVVRLSPEVYGTNSMAAVGIAAHECGHALQDAKHYAPLVVRNMAVPIASFGGNIGGIFLMVGMVMMINQGLAALGSWAMLIGIVLFGATVLFQLINLPVEFDASSRAKTELVQLGIISGQELPVVSKVLSAAAMTYVAGTLQSIVTLLYYFIRYSQYSRRD